MSDGSARPAAATARGDRLPPSVGLLWLASAAVIVACAATSFRLGLAEGVATALAVNGARVLLGAAAGAALALSGCLRLAADTVRPLGEVEVLAVSAGAAGGGFVLAGTQTGATALLLFALGAVAGALGLVVVVRRLDRPRRWTNLAVVLLIAALAGVAALAGTYVRTRRDAVAVVTTWLLGDLGGATAASATALAGAAALLLLAATRATEPAAARRRETLSLLALGLGVGAVGPLAFVGTLAPRAVRRLACGATERALLPLCAAAGAATVVAVDAVPRLLVGGYDFPWNAPAAMLAVPLFGGWNRMRLRRAAGRASVVFEVAEVALLVGLTLLAVWLATTLAGVIRAAT